MKKIIVFCLYVSVLGVGLMGCSSQIETQPAPEVTIQDNSGAETDENTSSVPEDALEKEGQENASGKNLVVYFSVPETTDPDNMTQEEDNSVVVIDGEVLGNTQYVAMVIAENIGGELFRIEPEIPYTTDHDALVDLADRELEENARPALKANIENLDDYDTIFVGYPIWWSDMPMILYTFFDENDFSGKTIVPFSTHGGSRLAGTVDKIIGLEPDAEVIEDAFTVSRNDVQDSEGDILEWLDTLGYME